MRPEANQTIGACPHDHSEAASDLLLLEGIKSGCEECFGVIFRRYCRLVYQIAQRMLRNRSEAEDLLQEVFLAIFEQRYKYDGLRGTVRVWIYQIAHFKALMRRRSLGIRHVREQKETIDFDQVMSEESCGTAEIQARAETLEAALGHLRNGQRRAIELIHFDGYTLQETAAILGESLANTRNLYYRGIKTLRSWLQDASRSTGGAVAAQGEHPTLVSGRSMVLEHR